MKTTMDSLQDLIEEAKLRTLWWILCIFAVTYFLTHTSKSMLMNVPIAVLLVCGMRILFNEVEFRRKVRDNGTVSYLSHLEKKQLSVNDSRLSTPPVPQKWKRKIGSPVVEAAAEDFIGKVLNDFVVDLWYSEITPDKEAPQLIHGIIMDVLGEVAGRIREVNLVDLLTRDLVDLVGNHLDLFRRNQAAIGVDIMKTLSSEERDERLKHHLLATKELHPALISPECEYKVLKLLMGGLLAVVLRPREVQSPLVRCIARELLTCLVMQPIMNFASPGYINELIEFIILASHNEGFKDVTTDQSPNVEGHNRDGTVSGEHGQSGKSSFGERTSSNNQGTNMPLPQPEHKRKIESGVSENHISSTTQDAFINQRADNWAKVMEAATQRREEILMPENLENMWTIGRNYKKELQKRAAPGLPASETTDSVSVALPGKDLAIEAPSGKLGTSVGTEDKGSMQLPPRHQRVITDLSVDSISSSQDHNKEVFSKRGSANYELENTPTVVSLQNRNKLKRANSASDFKAQSNLDDMVSHDGTTPIINEYYSADINKFNAHNLKSSSDIVLRTEQLHTPKLRCRVTGAYFEKLGTKSFAVYLIAVTDAENNTRFVKRRYRNFERLHRHLKEIPNYTLHLPPKRIFSSNTNDTFVHQRCLQLDKYLQDLLSVANVAEQHEVLDFLSDSSKNYSFGKSPSVMRTLAVNVDDAMDDIVRQVKGVSGGLTRSVAGPSSSYYEPASSTIDRNLSWNSGGTNKLIMRQRISESIDSFSDHEEGDKDGNHEPEEVVSAARASGWDSDNELDQKGFSSRAVNLGENVRTFDNEAMHSSRMKSESSCRYPESSLTLTSVPQGDPTGVPLEWTPPNLSVPVLNLVDNIFQLKRRGWLRRQVFWISKQILQLVMEDALDDWLLRQIQWLRREDVIAQGIRWVKDVLWPNGTFFLRLRTEDQSNNNQDNLTPKKTTSQPGGKIAQPGSFEEQLEAARRASIVKKMIFDGAPTTLVSLIGHKQYKRSARDMYYFLQSTVCLKLLGYGMLELVLISIFPELRDIVTDMHQKMHIQPL